MESLLGRKLGEGVTSIRCRNWKGSSKVSYEDIISIKSNFGSNEDLFPYISSSGNFNVFFDDEFDRASKMHDERVDLIIDMQPQQEKIVTYDKSFYEINIHRKFLTNLRRI